MECSQKRRALSFLSYLIVTLISAVLLKLAHIPEYKIWEKLFPNFIWLVMILGILWIFFLSKNKVVQKYPEWITVLWFSYLFTLLNVFLLRNTYYSYSGVENDLEFVTAAVTKYANYLAYVDFTYQGLSAFYPPFYFYLLGKISWLLGIEPFMMVRYGLFTVVAILPPILYWICSRLFSKSFAMIFSISVFLILHISLFYKQYEFITLVLILPWWTAFMEPDKLPQSRKKYISFVLIGGVLGAFLFQTYYYWFFLLLTYLCIQVILYGKETKSIRKMFLRFRHPLLVLIGVAIFSSVYWLPLVLDFGKYGIYPSQAHYFKQYMLDLPFKMGRVEDFVYLLGLVGLILVSKVEQKYRRFLWMVVACLVWQAAGHLGLAIGKPLLHFKMLDFLHLLTIIGIAAAIAWWTKQKRFQTSAKVILATSLSFIVLFYGQKITDFRYDPAYQKAMDEYKPKDIQWIEQHLDYKGKVFLTDQYKLHSYLPTYDFVSWGVFYSHHSGRREERIQFLEELSKSENPTFIAWMLRHNKYDAIDYLHLQKGRQIEFVMDPYPNVSVSKLPRKLIEFPTNAFQDSAFVMKGQGILQVRHLPVNLYHSFSEKERRFADQYMDIGIKNQLKK